MLKVTSIACHYAILVTLEIKAEEKEISKVRNYFLHTCSLMQYGFYFVLTKIIGSIRSLFNFDNVLVIGAGYTMEKYDGGENFKESEYERLARLTGDPYYACMGYLICNPYRNSSGICVQLWENPAVLTQDWKNEDYFEKVNHYFGKRRFKPILIDWSVDKFMQVRKWVAFIKEHLTEGGTVVLPQPKFSMEIDRFCRMMHPPQDYPVPAVVKLRRNLENNDISCEYKDGMSPVLVQTQ